MAPLTNYTQQADPWAGAEGAAVGPGGGELAGGHPRGRQEGLRHLLPRHYRP